MDVIVNGTPIEEGVWVREYNHFIGVTRGKKTNVVRVETNGHSRHSRPYTPEKAKNTPGITQGRLTPLQAKRTLSTSLYEIGASSANPGSESVGITIPRRSSSSRNCDPPTFFCDTKVRPIRH